MASAHHLIVGGQRSGKSRRAEHLACAWRAAAPGRAVTVVATARAADDEMRARIARHRADRPLGFDTVEEPLDLAAALRAHASPGRLLLVDCLTLWLTNWLMPAEGEARPAGFESAQDELLAALDMAPAPVLLVSNEVGWGLAPLGAEVRAYVDALGRLNQAVARHCGQLTLMVAGQPWTQEVQAW